MMRWPRSASTLVAAVAALVTLAACSPVGPLDDAGARGDEPRFAYVARVETSAQRTAATARRDATVIAEPPGAGFAILGYHDVQEDAAADGALEDSVGALAAPVVAEAGGFTLWSGGYTLWSGGDAEAALQENASLWRQIGLTDARALSPRAGAGVMVAVLDTGVDLRHPAFATALAPEHMWFDVVDRDGDPDEVWVDGAPNAGYGHGTAVAGIVTQVAPHATIVPVRVLDAEGVGDLADVIAAIDWIVALDVDIAVVALGTVRDSASLRAMVEYASERGVFVVASAGNGGDRRVTYPGAVDDDLVVSVGSVDEHDVKSSFSTYGSHLTLVAPGERVATAAPDGMQAVWTGTSMAAPLVAGALALALGELPPTSVAEREALLGDLMDTLVDVDESEANSAYGDDLGGRLDVDAFLRTVSSRLAGY